MRDTWKKRTKAVHAGTRRSGYGEMSEAVKALFKTPEQGAATMVWAATSAKLNDRGGEYCEDCDIAALNDETAPRWSHVMPWAVDDGDAKRLWAATEAMVLSAEA